jgi:uncharacterized membrane protein
MDSRKKTVLKTISWRFLASGSTLVISYMVTQDLSVSGIIVGVNFFSLMLLYYLHERFWTKIS